MGLCLIDSGATLNFVSESFVTKARLVSKPLRSPLGVAPFEGPPLQLTKKASLSIAFSLTWLVIGVSAVESQMTSPRPDSQNRLGKGHSMRQSLSSGQY